jgi:hypothetical protein
MIGITPGRMARSSNARPCVTTVLQAVDADLAATGSPLTTENTRSAERAELLPGRRAAGLDDDRMALRAGAGC